MQNRHSFLSVTGKGWKVNQPVTGLHGVTQGSMSSLIHPMPVHVHHTQVTASASIRAVDSLCISRHSPWVNWTTAINTSIKHFLTKKFKKRFNTYLGFLSGLDVEDLGSRIRKIPWRRKLQYSCLGNPRDRGDWWVTTSYSLWGCRVRHEWATNIN